MTEQFTHAERPRSAWGSSPVPCGRKIIGLLSHRQQLRLRNSIGQPAAPGDDDDDNGGNDDARRPIDLRRLMALPMPGG